MKTYTETYFPPLSWQLRMLIAEQNADHLCRKIDRQLDESQTDIYRLDDLRNEVYFRAMIDPDPSIAKSMLYELKEPLIGEGRLSA